MTDERKPEDAAEEMELDIEDRDATRSEEEVAEQQDLNQGMSTGTRDSTRHGVNWGRSYKTHPKPAAPKKP